MPDFLRGIAIAIALAGIYASLHPQTASSGTSVSSAAIPVPVCPPNDPNACHIDDWGK